MRLRQIKLSGFKSFADPTLIELNDPFVGVVGPNGCGKSNVIDAVRWVLGEGRASELRGLGMTDLIFAGSSGRAPMGRASVELVLENDDGRVKGPWGAYAELSIKRVVTAEGESGYFINHQQVRRRDVQEIFLGTGLGPKSYAIISQGMISNFIRAKPEELRVYLEEAAGVSLYKERRRETESLLRSTLENIERAEDLQTVRGEEIARLKEDAGRAARWKELTDRRTESEGLLYFLQYEDAKNELERVRTEGLATVAALQEKRAAYDESTAQHAGLAERATAAEHALAAAEADERRVERELARLEGEAKRTMERRAEAERHLAAATATLEAKKARLASENEQLAADRESRAVLTDACDEADALEAEAAERLEAAEIELEAAETGRRQTRETVEALRRRTSVDEAALGHERNRLAEIERNRSKTEADRAAAEASRPDEKETARLKDEVDEAEAAAEECAERLEAAETLLEETRSLADEADKAYFALLGDLKAKGSRLAALEEVQAGAEQQAAFSEWLEARGLTGIPAFLEEALVEEGALTALEAVLGARVRALLLRDLRAASGFERERPPALLSFAAPVPGESASEASGGALSEALLKLGEKCALRPLSDVVTSAHPAVAAAVRDWCAGVGLVESLAEAMRVRESIPEGVTLVTPKGDIVGRASITFFASDAPENSLLARAQEIRRLTDEIEAAEVELGRADDRRQKAAARAADAKRAVDDARRGASDAERTLSALKLELKDREAAAAAWRRRDEDLRRSSEELEAERAERTLEIESILERLEAGAEALETAERADASAAARETAARANSVRLAREAADARERVSILGLKAKQLRDADLARTRTIEDLTDDIERERQRVEAARRTIDETDREELDAGTRALVEDLERLRRATAEARNALEIARATLSANEAVSRELQGAMLPLTEAIGTLKLAEGEKKTLLEQYSQRMDEVGADWTRMSVVAQTRGVKIGTVRNEVSRLAGEIAALGPVNHAALLQLEEAEKVFEATRLQIEDLRTAANTLESAIRTIDADTRSRMRETFERVNAYFKETFTGLFGGGHAELTMTGDEILASGIDVTAQPPGKKNASVRSLSGGEQALTATALVFAMFKLNPAPFCLLDEVDAPLDEANQARLAGLCLKMSDSTQFLMITHHRVTMEFTKALIGVTMREPGVSRVVSVDLDEAVRIAESASGDRATGEAAASGAGG